MIIRLLSFILILFFCTAQSFGQCLTATVPDTVCAGQPFDITNTTPGFEKYYWDFCTGDLNNTPVGSNIGNPGSVLTAPHQIEIVEDSGSYYGFVANLGSNNIIRLDYGNSPANIPVANTLIVSSLGNPTSIAIIKENNNWYALAGNYVSGDLMLLDFGISITNLNPVVNSLGNPGLSNPFAMNLIKYNNNIFVFIANYTGNSITRLEFGSSILNVPVFNNFGGTFANPFEVEVVYDCVSDKFIGFVSNLGANYITVLDFGKNLELTPVITQLSGLPIQSSTALEILHENTEWHILFTDEVANEFSHFNLGSNILNTTPSLIYDGPLGGLSTPRGLYFLNYESQWHGTIINWANSIIQAFYPDTCIAIPTSSDSINPSNIALLNSGTNKIQLNATDADGNMFFLTEKIYVLEGPVSNYTYSSDTCDNIFNFTDSSYSNIGSINAWFWDFGDGSTSTSQNPSHTFLVPGYYNVKLTVTATNGCAHTIEKIIFNDKPIASFTVIDGCIIPPLDFINTSPDSQNVITSWNWDFGDSNNSNLANPSHTYANPGNYIVSLIASIGTCSDTLESTVTYQPKPEINFSVFNTCSNQQQQFINNSTIASGTIISYLWNLGDGNTSSLSNPSYQYADTGNFVVSLIATGDNGCIDTLSKTVRISLKPDAAFSYSPNIICSENIINFLDLSSVIGDTLNNWSWYFGNGDSTNIQNPDYQYLAGGQYNISLIVSTGTDCIDSTSQQVLVEPSPVVSFSATTVCYGDTTEFTDLSSAGSGNLVSWNWNFGNGDTSGLQNPVHVFPVSGNIPISLTVVSDIGCSSSDTININVASLPVAAFQIQDTCSNKYTQFTDVSTISSGIINSWAWNFGDPASGSSDTSTFQNPTHNYEFPGNYLVTLQVESADGCVSEISQNIGISRTPTANFSTSQACDGEHVSFTYLDNSFPSNATNWFWDFGNSATSSIENPATLYLNWGIYNVTLIVADSASGCTDTITKPVEVDPIPVAYFGQITPCIGTPFTLIDSSQVATGSIQGWHWNINSDVITDQNPVYVFPDTGEFIVYLEVTSDKGCVASITDTVFVSDLPVSNFTFSPTYGDAPLPVNFINSSNDAQSFIWDFGDGSSSTDPTPTHIFTDTGSFNITLIAINEFGCRDSNTKSIYIIQPNLDIAVLKIFPVVTGNFATISVEISNFGTREVTNYYISVRLAGKLSIQEYWTGSLKTGETMIYRFNAALEITEGDLNLICVSVIAPNGETDDNISNNTYCISLIENLEIVAVSPNPGIDMFTIHYSLPVAEDVNIILYDSKGALIRNLYSGPASKGYNSVTFSAKAAGIGNGVYYVNLSNSTNSVVYKMIVN